jgi:peptidoglycan hydrolase-like protein with peptidoglycan-binding domain
MSVGGRRGFLAAILAATLSLGAAACSGSGGATTTTEPATSSTTSTTSARITLEENGPVYLKEGDRGAAVEALQFYLVCTGHGQIGTDGAEITVDGIFGPMTAEAVAWYQAELRRMPSGSPDEETFASLARDCSEPRLVSFPQHQGTTKIAGNVAPGDDEIIDLEGVQGRVLTVTVGEGDVSAILEQTDGTRVQQVTLGGGWSGKLPTDADYQIRVTAAEPISYSLDLSVARPRFINIDFGRMRLVQDGFGILTFGDDAERVIGRLEDLLGSPNVDTGWATGDAGGRTCTGNNRHLTWIIQPADSGDNYPAVLYVHFSDVDTGSQAFAEYAYVSLDPQAVDAGAMDLATTAGISIGLSVADFATAYGQPNYLSGSSEMAYGGGVLFGFEPAGDEQLISFIGSGADGCDGYQ